MESTTLVLLPGLDGTEEFFGPLLDRLPPWIAPRVVPYPEQGPNGYADLLPLVDRTLASVGECLILGWSFGGPLALMAAAARPAQVRGVVLFNSFVSSPRPAARALRCALQPLLVATLRALRRTRYLVPGYACPELRRAKARTWRRVDAAVLTARARSVLDVDARELLALSSARVLCIVASRDEVIPRRCAEEILQIAPHAEFAEIDGPHMALFSNPGRSATLISRFASHPADTGRRA
jgi:pimeloyl-ACP methyl ester carboxylesterase